MVEQIWESESLFSDMKGVWIRTSLENIIGILYTSDVQELNNFLHNKELIPEDKNLESFVADVDPISILAFDDEYPRHFFYMRCSKQKGKSEPYGTYLLDMKYLFDRIPSKDKYETLGKKKVTIIGCGSGGSKIAEYLAKAGVRKFVLIDEDILTVQNIIRHTCQLNDISIEKVFAVKNKLLKINPEIQVEVIIKCVHVVDSYLETKIKDSDIVIMATASYEEVINEYTYSRGIPTIYPKIYPFGFGGEILRIIPSVTPCFECAHQIKEIIISEQFQSARFPEYKTIAYDLTADGEQVPLPALAIDSDFIVLIAAKMALEVLMENNYDIFNNSPNIILWGNTKEWIFEQDYECLKIDNKTLKSFEGCIICHGEKVTERELEKSSQQIEAEYKNILLSIKNDHAENNSD